MTCVISSELEWNLRSEGSDISGTFMSIEDGDYADLGTSGLFTDASAFGYVRLGIMNNEIWDHYTMTDYVTVDVEVDITTYDNSGNSTGTVTETLSVVMHIAGGIGEAVYQDEYRMDGVHKFEVEVVSVTVEDDASNPVSIPTQVFLKSGFYAERYYNLETSTALDVSAYTIEFQPGGTETVSSTPQIVTTATTDEIELFWNYIAGAESYDVEWTWVDSYSETSVSTVLAENLIEFNEADFKRNSTRINTSDQFFRIPQVFERGYLIYRVRAVGRWLNNTDQIKYGKWSSGGSSKTHVVDWPDILEIVSPHQDNLNWQYQATYAENGKKKEVVQYFDGSLRSRQTVTRINSDYQAIIGENVYDNQGRKAITILPSPIDNAAIKYYNDFNQNTSNDAYSHLNFDWEDTTVALSCMTLSADPLSDASGASLYYSENHTETNWQQYVADAEGYAFSQMQYTPDNTGRIRRQSGVGDKHKMGSGQETEYYYLQPSQEELNRLFGYRVGFKKRYKKNMVVDANGQVSISYLDPQGRVIATSLAGDNNTNFNALDSETGPDHGLITTDLLAKLDIADEDTEQDDNELYSTGVYGTLNDGLQMTTQLGVVDDGDYDFWYNVITSYYEEDTSCNEVSSTAYPYVYDLTIDLLDDCGESQMLIDKQIGTQSIGTSSGVNTTISAPMENISLLQGSYHLSKTIKVNEQALEAYLSDYLSNSPCVLDITDFYEDPALDCNTSCQECEDDLGTLSEYLALKGSELGGELTPQDSTDYTIEYNYLLEECWVPCEQLSTCDALRFLMLNDVSPYGQYGSISQSDEMSVFNTGNNLPGTSPNWQNPSTTYKDEYGNDAVVENSSGTQVAPENLTRAEFLAAWESSWAESLLPYHPEYPLFAFQQALCNEVHTIGSEDYSSDAYDRILLNEIMTYDEAQNNSYGIDFLNGIPIYEEDPYFNLPGGYAVQNITVNGMVKNYNTIANNIMNEAITAAYLTANETMLEFAVKTVICGSNLQGLNNCTITSYDTWSKIASSGLTTAQKDEIWQQYKNQYLGLKKKIQQIVQDFYGFQDNIDIYNGCLSDGVSSAFGYTFLGYFNWSSSYNTLISDYFDLEYPSAGSTSNALCGSEFEDKEARILRVDGEGLIGGSGDAQTDLDNAAADIDYVIWQETGLCPLMKDMEYLLHSLGVNGNLTSTTNSDDVDEFTPDLFLAMGGSNPAAGAVDFVGTSNGTTLDLVVEEGTTNLCTITIEQVGSYSWSNYGSTWEIFDLSSSYPLPLDPNGAAVLITAGSSPATAQEYVVEYSGCIDLNDCQTDYAASNTFDCGKEEELAADIMGVMNYAIDQGFFDDGNNHSLSGYSAYQGSLLGEVAGDYSYTAEYKGFSSGTGFLLWYPPYNYPNDYLLNVNFSSLSSAGLVSIQSVTITNSNQITVTALYDNSGTISTQTVTGSILEFSSGSENPLVMDCDCFEPEFSEGEDFAAFISHLTGLTTPPTDGYYPSATEYDASDLFSTVGYENPIIYDYTTSSTGITFEIADDLGAAYDYGNCSITIEFNDTNATGYLGADIEYIFDVYFPGNNNTTNFEGKAMMDDTTILYIDGTVECLNIQEVESQCDGCLPSALYPVSCNEAYVDYDVLMDGLTHGGTGLTGADMTEEEFCDAEFAYILEAYDYYLTQLGVSEINSSLYVTISEFGATLIGYDNDLLTTAVDDFKTFYTAAGNDQVLWNEYIDEDYMETNEICPGSQPSIEMPDTTITFPCNQWTSQTNLTNAQTQYQEYIDAVAEEFKESYIQGAIASLKERFIETHADKEYHYTLYYYDRAGNLFQTVPPKGVDRLDASDQTLMNNINLKRVNQPDADDTQYAPNHTYETEYKYNTLNQLVYQRTPDGGESRFAYDALGRLVVSQNAKQEAVDQFSYTRYDALGRVVEVGELTAPNSTFSISPQGKLLDNGVAFDVNASNFPNNFSTNREEVVHTLYDDFEYNDAGGTTTILRVELSTSTDDLAENRFNDFEADNTRNRIMATVYQAVYDSDINTYDNGTLYNYDVHGNVKELIQVNHDDELLALEQTEKRVEYTYDLVSGNVEQVVYQAGQDDEFRHKYEYDADNRITNAYTSRDGVVFEQDAKYFYYEHGPLARTEIGQQKVQACDYAYTIQGWIKSVNGEEIDEQTMMGNDGNTDPNAATVINQHNARDAFGYSLSYFEGDYKSSNTAMLNHTNDTYPNLGSDIYNGNINTMFTALSDENETTLSTHQTKYTYDQLNRITSMSGSNRTLGQLAQSSGYSSSYSYDENGNLQSLRRFESGGMMDNFTYQYNDPVNGGDNNRLTRVDDAISDTYIDVDVDDQNDFNYAYDKIGQLIKDDAENITSIAWTVNNKVDTIKYGDGKEISFEYSPMGNRISKRVVPATGSEVTTTFYVLDAQGNPMSKYTLKENDGGGVDNNLYLSERNIYGSSRVGVENIGEVIASSNGSNVDIYTGIAVTNGDKYFELSNHLGNVLEVVSDIKLPEEVTETYSGAATIQGNEITVNGSNIATTITTTGWGVSGGTSVETVLQGEDYFEWTIGSDMLANRYIMCGISYDSPNHSFNTIDYSWYIYYNNVAAIFESGSNVGIGGLTYAAADIFRIERNNGNIIYKKNGSVIRTVTDPNPNDPMIIDFAFYQPGTEIYDLQIHTERDKTYFLADVQSYSDYYPGGMIMPGRSGSTPDYRYGFNGMEKDDEVKGEGNSYTTEFRQYDPRIMRWTSRDPMFANFPWQSPYVGFDNNPVVFNDPKGQASERTTGGEDPPETKVESGAGGTDLVLPKNAKVLGKFLDKDKNGRINHGKKDLSAEVGDVDRFEADGVNYRANFNKDGSFNGYFDANGNKWKSPVERNRDIKESNGNYIPPPKNLPGIPGAERLPSMDGKRTAWKLPKGDWPKGAFGEWDSENGEVEVYDKTGKNHQGAWNPETGEKKKPGRSDRKASRSKLEAPDANDIESSSIQNVPVQYDPDAAEAGAWTAAGIATVAIMILLIPIGI
ncbi:MAG: hypothetical protein COA32_14985 [Fluviicola sp.]|nr:MAG: hypothetical protein COA32_14985 [Fluviicola sp.]